MGPSSLPSQKEMYDKPYGVLTEYYLSKNKDPLIRDAYQARGLNKFEDFKGADVEIDRLKTILKEAYTNERAKEEALLQYYLQIMPAGKLKEDFAKLINAKDPKNRKYSEAFDTMIKAMNGFYKFDTFLKDNQDLFAKRNKYFLSEKFIKGLMSSLGRKNKRVNASSEFADLPENTTGESIISNIITTIKKDALASGLFGLQGSEEFTKYEKFLSKAEEFLHNTYITSFAPGLIESTESIKEKEKILKKSIKELENSDIIREKRKDSKYSDVPVNRLIYNQIWGLLNGMGLEVFIDFSGGARTGSVKSNGLNIKADDVMIFTIEKDLEINKTKIHSILAEDKPMKEKILNAEKKEQLDEFLKMDNSIESYIVLISAKDQSLTSGFTGKTTPRASTIKFAEDTASLNKRFADLEQMAGRQGIKDLLFSLVNLEEDLVCSGMVEQTKAAIGAVCMNWMFDDFSDIITIPHSTSNNKLHVYNLSGWYITLSEILRLTYMNVSATQKSSSLVTVNLTVPSYSSYNKVSEDKTITGIAKWDAVRADIMNNTKLGMQLKTKSLFDIFYK